MLADRETPLSPLLDEVGRRLARLHKPHTLESATRDRLERATAVLEEMGGLPLLREADGIYRIEGASCPIASVVKTHGESACTLARALLEELTELPVEQQCQTNGDCPECAFVVDKDSV